MHRSQFKHNAIEAIFKHEGGYVNDPKDSGGETNWGITIWVARQYGYKGDMKDMSKSMAHAIYAKRFWDALSLDQVEQLSPVIASELLDTGVNQGVGRAAEILQRALNALNNVGKLYSDIRINGDIGPATLAALTAYLDKRGADGEIVV